MLLTKVLWSGRGREETPYNLNSDIFNNFEAVQQKRKHPKLFVGFSGLKERRTSNTHSNPSSCIVEKFARRKGSTKYRRVVRQFVFGGEGPATLQERQFLQFE
jgi:hypothetical protein